MWTPDPISLEVIKKLTGLAIDLVWKRSGDKITEQLRQQVGTALEKYVRTYEERHCTLKYACLRMDDSLRLEEIYTDVQVLEARELRYFQSHEDLEDLFRKLGRGFQFGKTTRQAGIAVANQFPRLVVLGSPGIGKSTFLKKVGLEALKWETSGYRHEVLPVFLELKRFDASQTDIESFIAAEFEECGFPQAETFTDRMLAAGKLLVLLDGLDEVSSDHVDRAIEQIGNLVDRYDQNRFITSCRIAAYKGGFLRFKDVTMADFDDEQIEKFIDRWFYRKPKLADQCWELLKSTEYKVAKELGQTPLLLTLLCAVYGESLTFPKQRSTLYGEALEVWLKNWTTERRVHRDPIYRELCSEDEQFLLSKIAYKSFSEQQLFFSKKELTKQIRAFLTSNLNAPKHLDAEAVLTAIQIQQGILVERARDQYSFSHLTFQEYLTAQYIVEEGEIEALVTQHLTDQTWREVFLLVSGLMRSDELLILMEQQAQKFINTEKLRALISWAEKATANSEGIYKPAAKRSSLIYLATQTEMANYLVFDLDTNLAVDLNLDTNLINDDISCLGRYLKFAEPNFDNFPPDYDRGEIMSQIKRNLINGLAHATELIPVIAFNVEQLAIFNAVDFTDLDDRLEALTTQIPSQDATYAGCRAFADQVLHYWYDALDLNPDWIDLSDLEIESLRHYLRANRLMIRCKETAVRMSPQVWNAIESRMLTVHDH